MIRLIAACATVLLFAPAAVASECSMLIFKGDLPRCVHDLESQIEILQMELQAERSRINLYSMVACNLALALNKSAPSDDSAAIIEGACAEAKDRLAAMKKRNPPKAKSNPQ